MADSYIGLRALPINQEPHKPLLVYLAKKKTVKRNKRQSEWVLKSVLSHLWASQSTDNKDARKKFRAIFEGVQNLHSLIWPESSVPELKESKHKSKKGDEKTDAIFPEATIPTSLLMSLLLFVLTLAKRKPHEKKGAVVLFRTLIEKAASQISGEVSLLSATFNRGCELRFLQISPTGKFVAKPWCSVLDGMIAPYWKEAFASPNAPWVTSYFENPHIADVICFSLMPTPTMRRQDADIVVKFKSEMEKPAYYMLAIFSQALEKHLLSLVEQPRHVRRTGRGHTKKGKNKRERVPTSTLMEIVGDAIEAITKSREVNCITTSICVFLVYLLFGLRGLGFEFYIIWCHKRSPVWLFDLKTNKKTHHQHAKVKSMRRALDISQGKDVDVTHAANIF